MYRTEENIQSHPLFFFSFPKTIVPLDSHKNDAVRKQILFAGTAFKKLYVRHIPKNQQLCEMNIQRTYKFLYTPSQD